jgi:hypothetical protein
MTNANNEQNSILTAAEAQAIVEGPWADVARAILRDSCFPIFWTKIVDGKETIQNSGTVTVYQTPTRLIGITAAHVLKELLEVSKSPGVQVVFCDTVVNDIRPIDSSDRHFGFEDQDIATFELDHAILSKIGKKITPLSSRIRVPEVGRGIMLCGYPAVDRIGSSPRELDHGILTVIGIARAVTSRQITWIAERDIVPEHLVTLPRNHPLGGISGGPLLGWFDNNGFTTYHLCGIISQSSAELEYVVAKRVDFIADNGEIRPHSL